MKYEQSDSAVGRTPPNVCDAGYGTSKRYTRVTSAGPNDDIRAPLTGSIRMLQLLYSQGATQTSTLTLLRKLSS